MIRGYDRHDDKNDVIITPRAKLFGGKGLDVLQSKLEPFEDFFVRLLQKPNLKKSDLLFTFLTSKQEFNEAASQLGLSRWHLGLWSHRSTDHCH